jgi:hypothetical protein
VNQLLHIFSEEYPEPNLHVQCSTIKYLQDMDNKMKTIRFYLIKEDSDIPLLMNMLKTPRADGKQHVVILDHFREKFPPQKMLNAIKQVFQMFFFNFLNFFFNIKYVFRIFVAPPNLYRNHFMFVSYGKIWRIRKMSIILEPMRNWRLLFMNREWFFCGNLSLFIFKRILGYLSPSKGSA